MGIRINTEKQPKAPQVLVVSTGPWASIKFGFWSLIGASAAFGVLLTLHRWVRLGWPLLLTWLGV